MTDETAKEPKNRPATVLGAVRLCLVLALMCAGLSVGCGGVIYVVAWAVGAGWRAGWGG